MDKAQMLATTLLLGRLIALYFIITVIKLQWGLFRKYLPLKYHPLRRTLFKLSITLLTCNLISVIIDALALSMLADKSTGDPAAIGVVYTLANMSTSIVSAILIWKLYRQSARLIADEE